MSAAPRARGSRWRGRASVVALLAALVLLGSSLGRPPLQADAPSGEQIMRAVDERPEGRDAQWDMELTLVDRAGQRRVRTARLLRKRFSVGGARQDRQLTVFLSPANVRQVALLSFDNKGAAADDDLWLYLPALKKLRRIPAAERGDSFVGTDLTYEDVKGGFAYQDYTYETAAPRAWEDGGQRYEVDVVVARPRTPQLAASLGYARTEIWVRRDIHARVRQEYYDSRGHLDRVSEARGYHNVDGVWTFARLTVDNRETGHRTELVIHEARYDRDLPDSLFHERTLLQESIR